MSRYKQLKELQNDGTLRRLIVMQFVSVSLWDRLLIYEYYLSEVGTSKMQAYTNTADQYRISERTVQRIVEWMESK